MLIDTLVSSVPLLIQYSPVIGSVVFLIGGIRSICVCSPVPALRAVFLAAMFFNSHAVLQALDIDETSFNSQPTAELVTPELASETKVQIDTATVPKVFVEKPTQPSQTESVARRVTVVVPKQNARPSVVELNAEISAN